MTLTDEQCAVLEKIASKSKMDCWFCIDGDNQIRDLEEGEKVIDTMEASGCCRKVCPVTQTTI